MSLSPFTVLVLAARSLLANPLRSALTSLGVFMGVAAVNATLEVGNISQTVIAKQLAARVAPQLIVNMTFTDARGLQIEDMAILQQQIPALQAISASTFVDDSEVSVQDRQAEVQIEGVSADHLKTSGLAIVQGRFLIAADFVNYRPVAVIDRFLADQLFPGTNPIGQSLEAVGSQCEIVGVVETKLNFNATKPKGQMVIPLSLVAAVNGSNIIDLLHLRPANLDAMKAIEKQAERILKQRYPGGEFQSRSNVAAILAQRQTMISLSWALLAVAGIALLVGGVGIANITIAEVMERTQEIGLRRAIGATKQDIMLQFMLEAALISLLGGGAAIVAVHGITGIVAKNFNLPYEFNSSTAALSLSTALIVGVGAGFFPARQASALDPVQALRSD